MKIIDFLVLILSVAICAALAQTAISPDTTQKTIAPATAIALTVSKTAFCTGVENREPTGESTEFPATVGKLCFWSQIAGSAEPTAVTHVWYHNDKEVARIELPVKYTRARIWSSKTIPSSMVGTWKVEVISADSQKLGEHTCVLK